MRLCLDTRRVHLSLAPQYVNIIDVTDNDDGVMSQ
jgi:hypothetical protein